MANEIVVEEYATFRDPLPIPATPHYTQVLDVAEASAAMLPATKYIGVENKGASGVWLKFGGSGVSAAANTNGNIWLAAGKIKYFSVGTGTYLDTAADA